VPCGIDNGTQYGKQLVIIDQLFVVVIELLNEENFMEGLQISINVPHAIGGPAY